MGVITLITHLHILLLTNAKYIDAVMQLASLLFVGISASKVKSGEKHTMIGFSAPDQNPAAAA